MSGENEKTNCTGRAAITVKNLILALFERLLKVYAFRNNRGAQHELDKDSHDKMGAFSIDNRSSKEFRIFKFLKVRIIQIKKRNLI